MVYAFQSRIAACCGAWASQLDVQINTAAPGGLPRGAQYLKHWYERAPCIPVYADRKVSIPSYDDTRSCKRVFFLTKASQCATVAPFLWGFLRR